MAQGDHSKNSFDGRFTAKAKVRMCLLWASPQSPEKKEGEQESETANSSAALEAIRHLHKCMGVHAHARWQGEVRRADHSSR